jgi:hypothetical protein
MLAIPRRSAGTTTRQGETMKMKRIGLAAVVLAFASANAAAQEH